MNQDRDMENEINLLNYDTTSHVWLEPFSAIIQSMLPLEIIYTEWFEYQENMRIEKLNEDVFFSSAMEHIETGSRVEGFCIPDLYVSKVEQQFFEFSPETVHWKPDKDTMASTSHNFQNDNNEQIPIFEIVHVENDKRYVKLRLTEEWKTWKPKFKDSTYLHQTYLLPGPRSNYSNYNQVYDGVLVGHVDRIHGPVYNVYREGKSGEQTIEFDQTTVFTYPIVWPEYAKEWLVRTRRNEWPSPELVQDIFESSCHVAPVGRGSRLDKLLDTCSYMKRPADEENVDLEEGEMDGYEWRISFSVAENKLANSIDPVPRYVLVLLKMIKKVYLPEEICTYHLKNILFWEVEGRDKSFWVEHNVMKCLLHMLDRLHDCLLQRRLMHYFIPESNLLSSISSEQSVAVAKVVENVRINIVSNLLSLLRRIQSLGFSVKEFIFSFGIDEYLHRIQDGSQTQSQVTDLYSSVLMYTIKQLNDTVVNKSRIYQKSFLKEYTHEGNVQVGAMLALYVYQSTLSRMICEAWISFNSANLKNKNAFLTFVRQLTTGIEQIKGIPSVGDTCLLYHSSLVKENDTAKGILSVLDFTKETLRIKFAGTEINSILPGAVGLIGDQKEIVKIVTEQLKELDIEDINNDLLTKLTNEQFKPGSFDESLKIIVAKQVKELDIEDISMDLIMELVNEQYKPGE